LNAVTAIMLYECQGIGKYTKRSQMPFRMTLFRTQRRVSARDILFRSLIAML